MPLRSVIRLNDPDVTVCGVSEKPVGFLIGRTFVRSFRSFDTVEFDQNNPFVHPQFENYCWHAAGKYTATGSFQRRS